VEWSKEYLLRMPILGNNFIVRIIQF
jgi:hypothetical protein